MSISVRSICANVIASLKHFTFPITAGRRCAVMPLNVLELSSLWPFLDPQILQWVQGLYFAYNYR